MIPGPNHIQAVLFDLDDTLIDWSGQTGHYLDFTRPHLDNVYNYLSAENHDLPDRDVFYENYLHVLQEEWRVAKTTWSGVNFGRALQTFFNALGLNCDRIDVHGVMCAYGMRPIPGVVLYSDTKFVLEALRQNGYKIGLVTNSMMPMWMRDIELQAYDIIDYFDVRLTSGDVGFMKPHPRIYHQALKRLNVQPQHALFVGDRPANDVAGANAAGMISVWMSPPHIERELNDVEPDHIIASLSELLPILDKLEQNHEKTRSK
ncbi:MAG: HAD family hydrolase [Candidatus Promineifilaceae bacterium]|nr:HAD family hydrolase [Candidatus Promineifilaceae bacterium]